MPQSGTMSHWQVPPALRVEHATISGAAIPPFYDSMIAKLVAHGRTREEARRKLLRGVQDTVALGVRTNQEFLARCLAHPVFAGGGATTAFVSQQEAELLQLEQDAVTRATLVGAWLLHATAGPGRHDTAARSLAPALPLGLQFTLDGSELAVSVCQLGPDHFSLVLAGRKHELKAVAVARNEARFTLDGVLESAAFAADAGELWLHLAGRQHALRDLTRSPSTRSGDTAGDGRVRAAMNGRVVAVLAAIGEKVMAGQPLVTLEAMKMEHVHSAGVTGIVQAMHVSAGEQVQAQRVLAEVRADAQPQELAQ